MAFSKLAQVESVTLKWLYAGEKATFHVS